MRRKPYAMKRLRNFVQHLTKTSVSLFLGLRYLRPKRNFVSLITAVSVVGVMLGVGLLTAVIAIMTGYSIKMRDTVLAFQPHLVVGHSGVLYDWTTVKEAAETHPEVVGVAPFSHGQIVLDFDRRLWVISVQGLYPEALPPDPEDPEAVENLPPIERRLYELIAEEEVVVDGKKVMQRMGEFDLSDDYVVLGKALAKKMGIKLGDTVYVHSLANGREIFNALREEGEEVEMTEYIPSIELTVTGIFDSGRQDYDEEFVFVPLEIGQVLYNLSYGVHGLMLHLEDPYRAEVVQEKLFEVIEPPLNVNTWMERNRAIFDMVAMERLIMYVLLSIIMVVAGFCIMNTMITVTTQKRKDIGLLKALGARMDQIIGVFMGQGFAVGILGSTLGIIGAFLFLTFRQSILYWTGNVWGIEVFSAEVYNFYELPAKLTTIDIVYITGGAFLACAFSSLIPAYFAARMDAARALRNDAGG